jgi:hypothetical protein
MPKKFELSDVDKDMLNDAISAAICGVFREAITNEVNDLF